MFMTAPSARRILQVRTWNFPALVMYFMPLKGLYFSPYISRRFTLSPGGKKGERNKMRPSPEAAPGCCLRLCGCRQSPALLWMQTVARACVDSHLSLCGQLPASVWMQTLGCMSNKPILQIRSRQLCSLTTPIYSKNDVSEQLSWGGRPLLSGKERGKHRLP